jgi:hypothetical protein
MDHRRNWELGSGANGDRPGCHICLDLFQLLCHPFHHNLYPLNALPKLSLFAFFVIFLFLLILWRGKCVGAYRGVVGRGGNRRLQVYTLLQGPEVECAKNTFFSYTAIICLFPIIPYSPTVRKGWGRVVSCGGRRFRCPYLLCGGHSNVCAYFVHVVFLGRFHKALHSPTIPCGFLVHSWSPGGFLVYSFHSCPFPGVLGKSWFIPTPFPVHSWSIPRTGGSGYGGGKRGGESV